MEDQYAAQLNEARNTALARETQDISGDISGEEAQAKQKKNILPSLVGIVLVALGIELVPFGDILPSFIGSVVAIAIRLKKAGRSINPVDFSFVGMLAGVADFSDWLIIGSIPIIGDIFDGMMAMILGFWSWWQSHSS